MTSLPKSAACLLLPLVLGCPPSQSGESTSSSSSSSSGQTGMDAGPTGSSIEMGALCSTLRDGFRGALLRTVNRCGAGFVDEDLERLTPSVFEGEQATALSQVQGQLPAVTCDQFSNLRIYLDHVFQSVDRGSVRYDAFNAFKCKEASTRPSLVRRDFPPPQQSALMLPGVDMPLVCNEVFTGLLEPQAPCDLTHECSVGHICRPMEFDGTNGRCVPEVPMGGVCDSRDVCVGGGLCQAGICQRALVLGESCLDAQGYTLPCGAGLICQGGQCQNYAETDALCGGANAPCRAGLVCARTSGPSAVMRCRTPVPDGETCVADNQCADCSFCNVQGRCIPFIALDQPCNKDADGCGPGLLCGDDSACHMLPREGEPCSVGIVPLGTTRGNCLYQDNFCRRERDTDKTGTCQPFPTQAGEPCGDGADTARTCQGGFTQLYCNAQTNGTCVIAARLGEACSLYGDTKPRCEHGYCRRAAMEDLEGVCAVLPDISEACGTLPHLSSYCQSGYCRRVADAPDGTCTVYPDIGEECGSDPHLSQQCTYGVCLLSTGATQGVCAYQKAAGETCALDQECDTLVCDPHLLRCLTPGQSCQGCSRFEPILFVLSLGLVIRRRRRDGGKREL